MRTFGKSLVSRPARTTAVVALVLVLLAAGVAYAAIPDGSGVIHGCRDKRTGTLRVIDSATSGCKAKETALNWSQTGPQGPVGPQGPQGAPDEARPSVAYSATGSQSLGSDYAQVVALTLPAGSYVLTAATDVLAGLGGETRCLLQPNLDSAAAFNQDGPIIVELTLLDTATFTERTTVSVSCATFREGGAATANLVALQVGAVNPPLP